MDAPAAPAGTLRLDVSAARLTLPSLLDLLEGLPRERLTELDASHNDLGEEGLLALLSRLPALRTLRLGHTGLTAEAVRASLNALVIRPPEGLRTLEMAACFLEAAAQDLGLFLASQHCHLTSLDLSRNPLGPEAAQALASGLAQNTTLQSLRLSGCQLRDAAVPLLVALGLPNSRMPLRSLGLARNDLRNAACDALGLLLQGSLGHALQELDISYNGVVGDELCSRALGQSLLALEDGEEVPGYCPAPLQLSLCGTRPFFNAALGRWDASPHLLTALRSPSCRVEDLRMDHCSLAEAAMPTLARACLNVRHFSFSGCPHGDALAEQLAALTQCLSSQHPRTQQMSARRSQSRPTHQAPPRLLLQELGLNDTGLQDLGAAHLAEALTWLQVARRDGAGLETLELAGNHLTAEAVAALGPVLAGAAGLKRLALSRNRLRQLAAQRLQECLQLRALGPRVTAVALELRHCALQQEGVLRLWRAALQQNVAIAELDLAENGVTDSCVDAMLKELPRGPGCRLAGVTLLPNPCSLQTAVAFYVQSAPWLSLPLHGTGVDAQTLAQLLHCLGSCCSQTNLRAQPGHTSLFSLCLDSGTSLSSKGWQWGLVAEAVRLALSPREPKPGPGGPKGLVRSTGAPWRRVGGCGGALQLRFASCELGHLMFKAPCSLRPSPTPATCNPRMTSLARGARRECDRGLSASRASSLAAQARTSAPGVPERAAGSPQSEVSLTEEPLPLPDGHAQRRPVSSSRRSSSAHGSGPVELFTASASSTSQHHPSVGRTFERHGDLDVDVPAVLRALREAEALRLVRCGIKDGWLRQLCQSVGSSKWSGVRLLDLRHNCLTGACCGAVASVVARGLEALVLDGNRVGAQGLEILCSAVKAGQRCGLKWLSVAENAISHPGGCVLAEALAMQGGCPLQRLCLARNPQLSCTEISTLLRSLCQQGREADKGRRLKQLDISACGAGPALVLPLARAVRQCSGLVIRVADCGLAEPGQVPVELEEFVQEGRVQL